MPDGVIWRLKIAAKLLLSRLPLPYRVWQRLSMFRHGRMDDPEYAIGVVERHMRNSGFEHLKGLAVLELGPGDSVASAVIAHALGARSVYLVDVTADARKDIGSYVALCEELERRGLRPVKLSQSDSVATMLGRCGARYLTDGLASLAQIPSGSIDFAWSHAVLEHVALADFAATMEELRRVLSPAGVTSNRVDFEDHLVGSLNNLRFATSRWETPAFRRSGFYTNRLRCSGVIGALKAAGFDEVEQLTGDTWDHQPLPTEKLAAEFRRLPDLDLRTRGADILARLHPASGAR